MTSEPDISTADAMTALILQIFRVNGSLLAVGDGLVSDLGLTSARWQVLGAIAMSPAPLPVAHIARNMGLTRQAVQRLVNEMANDGFVAFGSNPHHQRAKLVLLTPHGKAAYASAMRRQRPWAEKIAKGLARKDIDGARSTLAALELRLSDAGST
ncbi:MarR family transcriptional regulator [Hyphomicrobium sp. LHD-15]|uniref:MarR family winged helix-turn-helix transcriptional regulator n=1 Tax=Hyphomicrobium sp. LHD-15 TaxID=3072142 RepID=UPI00280C580D|nr:MarR family transcriptional regulator [Hyphomicrobium sp. LHD-15]MDQ8698319.1 MarR family transcriptional regulator [Hyphomicrobium sp. LHD-15]